MKTNLLNTCLAALLSLVLLLPACGKRPPVYPDSAGGEPSDSAPATDGWTYDPPSVPCFDSGIRHLGSDLYIADGCLYFRGGTRGQAVPTRLNLESGNITTVCPDPLCAHDSRDCPFYGTVCFMPVELEGRTQFLAVRRYSYPVKTLTGEEHVRVYDLERYDPLTGESTVLEEYDSGMTFIPEAYVGNYRFYVSSDRGEDGEWTGGVVRMDLLSGEKDMIFEGQQGLFLLVREDRIYMADGETLFSFDGTADDPAGTRRTERTDMPPYTFTVLPLTDGDRFYYPLYEDGDGAVRVIPLDTGRQEVSFPLPLASGWGKLFPADGGFCYFSGANTVLGKAEIPGYESGEVILYGEEFRFCRPDGSGDRLVYRFADEYASCRPLETISDGRYLYCYYTWWEDPDGDGVYRDGAGRYSFPGNGHSGCSLLRIDIKTGEIRKITVRADSD